MEGQPEGVTIRTGNERLGGGSPGTREDHATGIRPEVLWVRSFLETYCGPGRHNFLFVTPRGLAWCSNCFKEQPPAAAVCLICDSRSVLGAELDNVADGSASIEGGLCSTCLRAFQEEDQLGSWRLKGAARDGNRTQ